MNPGLRPEVMALVLPGSRSKWVGQFVQINSFPKTSSGWYAPIKQYVHLTVCEITPPNNPFPVSGGKLYRKWVVEAEYLLPIGHDPDAVEIKREREVAA